MDFKNTIFHGDCKDILKTLPDQSFRACITSPPYAEQRANIYGGVSESTYPAWTVEWMDSLSPKLTADGSVLIVIRPNIKKGQISDYVLKTRLALREKGWIECEELIWYKSDAPPLGSLYRPRRAWESILWFSKNRNPFVDLYACGNTKSKNTGGFKGSKRFGAEVISKTQTWEVEEGTSRVSDVFTAYISNIEKGLMHPAMYPNTLSDQLVKTFSAPGDTVIDPFVGSGTTMTSALLYKRNYCGIDCSKTYVDMTEKRIKDFLNKT